MRPSAYYIYYFGPFLLFSSHISDLDLFFNRTGSTNTQKFFCLIFDVYSQDEEKAMTLFRPRARAAAFSL